MIRKLRRFRVLPLGEKLLFLEAFLLHLWVGLLLKVVPFRRIPRLFASRQSAVGSQQSAIVENIRDAVQRAGQVSPWRNRCLVSSLAARCMLRRRAINSQIHLGIAKNAVGKTIAHAWLEAEGYEVVMKHGDYHDIYIF